MNKYEKYKSSGVDLIEEIPENWELKRLRYCATFVQTGNTPPSEEVKYYSEEVNWFTPSDFSDNLCLTNSKRKIAALAIKEGITKLFPRNCVLFVGIGATLGKVGYVLEPSSCNQQINCIGFHNKDEAIFYAYYFLANKNNIVALSNAATLPILNQAQMKDILLPVPCSKEEIKNINNFIISETGKIDALVERKEKLIALLKEERTVLINQAVTKGLNPNAKLKSSGIEWLGDINIGWNLKKLKFNTYVKARVGWHGLKSDEFFFGEGGAYCVTGTDFVVNKINWDTCYKVPLERYEEDQYIQLKENDLLITKDGTIGKVALVKKLKGFATLNSGVFVVRPMNNDYSTDYLFWVLQSKIMDEFISFTSKGSTIIHLYQDNFVNMTIPLPSLTEQIEIVKFIEENTERINSILTTTEKEIDLIKEYRTALINEVVTGKIKVS